MCEANALPLTPQQTVKNLFRLNIISNSAYLSKEKEIASFDLWHKRVGHVNDDVFKKMVFTVKYRNRNVFRA